MTNQDDKTMESNEILTAKIIDILAYQAHITSQGRDYRGEKDWALNRILKIINNEIRLSNQSLIRRVRDEIIELAEPYDGAKWHNNLSVKQLLSLPILSADSDDEGILEWNYSNKDDK